MPTNEYYRLLAGYDAGMLPASITTSLEAIFMNDPPDANERIETIAARHFSAVDGSVSDDDDGISDWGRHKAGLAALRDEFEQDAPDYKYIWVEGIDFGALDCGNVDSATKGALTLKIMSWNGGGGSPWYTNASGRVSLRIARLRRNDPDVDALWGDTLDEMVDYEAGRHRESIGDYIFGSDNVLPIEAAYRRKNARKAARTRAARKPKKGTVQDVVDDDPTVDTLDSADDPVGTTQDVIEDVIPALPSPRPTRPYRPARTYANSCKPSVYIVRTHAAPTDWCPSVTPTWSRASDTVTAQAERAERERLQARIDRLERERKEEAKQRELAERERMQLAERPRRGAVGWLVRKIQAVPACDWIIYGPLAWFLWWVIQVNIEARL